MKNVKVFSRAALEEYIKYFGFSEPTIVISISCPSDLVPRYLLYDINNMVDKIFVKFDDVECDFGSYVSMSDEDAKNIVDFVFKHKDVDNIVVHCDAGISRSAGVAAALSKIFNNDDFKYFSPYTMYEPNMCCYNGILNYWVNNYME